MASTVCPASPRIGSDRRRGHAAVRRWCLVLAIVLGGWPSPSAFAQDVAPAGLGLGGQEATAGESLPEAPLVVFNRTVAVFRAPLFGAAPEDRASRTAQLIQEILARAGPGIVTTQAEPQGNLILVDGELALVLTEADADRLRDQTLGEITNQAAAALRLVIAETRESRDSAQLLSDVVRSLVGTLVLIVFLALVLFVRRLLLGYLSRIAERAAAVTAVGGAQVVSADRLLPLVRGLVLVVSWLLGIVSVYRWLGYVLSQFPYTRPWGEQLLAFFVGTAVRLGVGILSALPDLVTAAFILLLARFVLGLVTPFLDRVAQGQLHITWLDVDSARPVRRLVVIGVWLFALAMAYPYLPGSQSEAFRGISVLVGLMVTFGGSGLFGQGASGIILMFARTIRVGEYVRIADHEGTVTEIGAFTTKVRTGLGEELTLPNGVVLGTVVKNYSRTVKGPGYIVDTTVTIGYDTPWRQVEAMLLDAARRTPGVLPTPAPRVFQTALSDFYPEYRLVCQAIPSEPRPRAEVLANLHANIQDVFNEHGVQIMSPHYLADPADAKVVPKQNWYASPARPPEA